MKLSVHPDVDRELDLEMAFLEDRRQGVGIRLFAEFARSLEVIQRFPKGAQAITGKLRQTPLRAFPYVVVFGVLKERVVVLALFHTSRRPKEKMKIAHSRMRG